MGGRLARESFKSRLAIGFFSRPPLAVVPQSRLIAGSAFHEQPRSAFKGESCGVYRAGCLPVLETMELVSAPLSSVPVVSVCFALAPRSLFFLDAVLRSSLNNVNNTSKHQQPGAGNKKQNKKSHHYPSPHTHVLFL